MSTLRLVAVVALFSAGLGVIVTSAVHPDSETPAVSPDDASTFDLPLRAEAMIEANETAAIAALRSLWSAQLQLQAAAWIDTDDDGVGEYGFFGELAGASPVRVSSNGDTTRVVATGDALDPPLLTRTFGHVDANGHVEYAGYLFRMQLPDASGAGVQETGGGGMGTPTCPELSEVAWCCYAWPTSAGTTGVRAFFVNQAGIVLQHANRVGSTHEFTFDGDAAVPEWSAAYRADGADGMAAESSIIGSAPLPRHDGRGWTIVR